MNRAFPLDTYNRNRYVEISHWNFEGESFEIRCIFDELNDYFILEIAVIPDNSDLFE